MTEERAIFTREIDPDGWINRDWHYAEPAPPKDWVPSCFMANSLAINKCAFPKRSIEGLLNPACEQCPYRKME